MSRQGRAADVDEELAEVVLSCWRLEIATIACCQDGGESLRDAGKRFPHLMAEIKLRRGRSYIDFGNLESLLRFYSAVANGGERNELYERMYDWWAPGAWSVLCSPIRGEGSEFRAALYQLEFPRDDIPLILQRLQNRLRQRRSSTVLF